jgi:hypothetical protein
MLLEFTESGAMQCGPLSRRYGGRLPRNGRKEISIDA